MSRSSGTRLRAEVLAGVAVATGLLLVGCASPAGSSGDRALPPGTEPDADGSSVVLRVEELGGFTSVESLVTRLPEISVHADGRAIREISSSTPVEELPALPEVVQRTMTPAGVDALVERARAAGVGDGADLGEGLIADPTTTRFLLLTDGGREISDAYALRDSAGLGVAVGEPVPSPSIPVGSGRDDGTFTPEQADARYRLLDLADALADLPATLGADAVGQEVPYAPDAVAVVAFPWGDQPAVDPIPWPGPPLPGLEVGGHGSDGQQRAASCLVVSGEDVSPVLEAAGRALWWTPWTDGGSTWSVRFRPLMPDESGCADLAPAG